MKKVLLGSMVVVVILGMSGAVASAQEQESDGKVAIGIGARIKSLFGVQKEERRTEVKVQIEAKKQEVEVKKEERKLEQTGKEEEKKEDKTTQQKERLTDFWNKTKKRLQSLIDQQTKLANRLDKRLIELKAKGKDITALQTQMTSVRALIKNSQDALNAADTAAIEAIKNNDQKVALEKIRDITKNVLEKIRLSHKGLVDLVNSTKGAKISPTPTPSVILTP